MAIIMAPVSNGESGNGDVSVGQTKGLRISFIAPLEMIPAIQNYPWGKLGSESIVAQLAGVTNETGPHAELWVGAHPKAPSHVSGKSLAELIAEFPETILGQDIASTSNQLPFLFKILSVGSALSIQAHPNIDEAQRLHLKDSGHYPDANHKPEMGVAITPTTLLYGFRPIDEIAAALKSHPELIVLLSQDTKSSLESSSSNPGDLLMQIYTDLVTATEGDRRAAMEAMQSRLKLISNLDSHDHLFIQMFDKFGASDIGLPSLFLLNHCELQPGQAFYIHPNLPHAYLSGDLVEVMANSDNVVRAGLTNKFQDLDTLLEMLDFRPAPFVPSEAKRISDSSGFMRYDSPAREFEIQVTTAADELVSTGRRVQLLFCISGAGTVEASSASTEIRAGTALLIPAEVQTYKLNFTGGTLFRVVVPEGL